jgi:hypothetical protein
MFWRSVPIIALMAGALFLDAAPHPVATASGTMPGFEPSGALDRNRFSFEGGSAWKGSTNDSRWWWQIDFNEPRPVGAILQIVGDHAFVFRNAPRRFVWQRSDDGTNWMSFAGTAITNEQRLYRVFRATEAVATRFLRLEISAVSGAFPTLREVEFFSSPAEPIAFPDWIVAVNSTHDPKLPNHGQEFIPLAKSCAGWSALEAQQVWVNDFTVDWLNAEPRPLCAFLSGSFKDWCEVDRNTWRGAQGVLRAASLPMWASCGGAQALAILAETSVDKPWDCPHCRDPRNPKTPIYTHIGHTAQRPCGDYSGCVFERGPHSVRAVVNDPVFRNLPRAFRVMQSHCGQIEWAPAGWSLIATAGDGARTKTQCLRLDGRPIYAAQFHIEMDGTPESSQQIMANFLAEAKAWASRQAPAGQLLRGGKLAFPGGDLLPHRARARGAR